MKVPDGSWPNSASCSLILVVFMTLALAGCSQRQGMSTAEESASPDQHLPFEGTSDKGGIFPTGSLTPAAIPAGTSLAIRLRTPLSSATSRSGDSFEATLDEPIVVRGKIVAPSGASVTGKVLDARAASELQEPGYMRLALIAVSLNGQSVPIQTSSIFVKRGTREKHDLNQASGGSAGAAVIGTPVAGKSIVGTTMGGTGMAGATIAGATINEATISRAKISEVSTGSLTGHSTLIGPTTGAVPNLEPDYATEDKDVGLSSNRRLIFRLAQPLPL